MKSPVLFQYAEFFAHLDEGGNATVEVFAVVSGRNLYADARLILRHDGVVETGHIDALVLETSCVVLREFGVIEHWVGLMSKPASIIFVRKYSTFSTRRS